MGLLLVTAPATTTNTLSEAKAYLRVSTSDDDVLLGSLLKSADLIVENRTRRKLITQTWDWALDVNHDHAHSTDGGFHFGSHHLLIGGLGSHFSFPNFIHNASGMVFEVPFPRLLSIVSVNLFQPDDTAVPVDLSTLNINLFSEPGTFTLRRGNAFPTNDLRELAAMVTRFTAGYGPNAADVPEDLRNASLRILDTLYDQREDISVMQAISNSDSLFTDDLILRQYEIVNL